MTAVARLRIPVVSATLLLLVLLAGAAGAGQGAAAPPKPAPAAKALRNGVPVEELPSSTGGVRRSRQYVPAGSVSRLVKVSPTSVGARDSRLAVLANGRRIPLRNGGRIDLAGGLAAEVYLDPYPPARSDVWLDLHLIRAATGKPVRDASGTTSYDMATHSMGPWSAAAKSTGDGHYLYSMHYIMYGDWGHLLRIQTGKTVYELNLLIAVLPA